MGQRPVKEVNPKPKDEAGAPGVPARGGERGISGPVKIRPVALIDQGADVTEMEGMPEEYRRGETMSGFPPSPDWQEPGEAVFGHFIGLRLDVGPNKSRIYELAAYQGKNKEPLTVAVWGSAALDRLFDSAFPPIRMGDRLAIIYLGEKPTQRGLNPVKLFALKIIRAQPSGVRSDLHGRVEEHRAS